MARWCALAVAEHLRRHKGAGSAKKCSTPALESQMMYCVGCNPVLGKESRPGHVERTEDGRGKIKTLIQTLVSMYRALLSCNGTSHLALSPIYVTQAL